MVVFAAISVVMSMAISAAVSMVILVPLIITVGFRVISMVVLDVIVE